ncbi:hypothetical protein SAMN05216268_12786 [Streptomyces yunnanensis]|uniref:Uncharacterized protein n=1 Tax=Streptomyces yunnanensis TaxID=156453 RepID=A0A9X8QZQ9_9ACTN|nr:hypothetical protein SAMN05216268_12786 [Streptomyces yunnanensis]
MRHPNSVLPSVSDVEVAAVKPVAGRWRAEISGVLRQA